MEREPQAESTRESCRQTVLLAISEKIQTRKATKCTNTHISDHRRVRQDSRARDVIHTTGENVCMHVNFALASFVSFVLQCFFPRFYRYVLCSFNNTNTHRTATLYFSVILCLAYRQGGKKFPFSVSLTVSIRELKVYFWIAI